MNKVIHKFWLIESKTNRKGEHPVYMRILVNGRKKEISTGIFIPRKDWDVKKEKVKSSNSSFKNYNLILSNLAEKFDEILNKIIRREVIVSVDEVKDMMFPPIEVPVKPKIKTFRATHNELVEELLNDKTISHSTRKKFRTVGIMFLDFLKDKYNIKDIDLEQLKSKHLYDYEKWMLVTRNYHNNTIIKYSKTVKAIINRAIKLELIDKNPFLSHVNLKEQKSPIVFLTSNELGRIEGKEITINRLDEVRDFFLLQCYTGMSYSDMNDFSKNDIECIEGIYFIMKQRRKTKVKYTVPIVSKAVKIFEKYNWAIPKLSNQRLNAYLKELGVICGIDKEITTHIGRKTFATLALSKGVAVEVIAKMVGHTSTRMTLATYADVVTERMINEVSKLEL